MKLTQIEIEAILSRHKLWLNGDKDRVRADLHGADLSYANLGGANLRGANLRGAELGGAELGGAEIDYQIEGGLLLKVAKAALQPDALNMTIWHTCETTHCIAGWACNLSPVAKELEKTHGTQIAALLVLGAEAHSHFFDNDKDATAYLQSVIERG